jgi:hypothetical protein
LKTGTEQKSEAAALEAERIKAQFKRQIGWALGWIMGPIFAAAAVIIVQFYGFGTVNGWLVFPFLMISAVGGFIAVAMLKCPKCGVRQPLRNLKWGQRCRKCGAMIA